MLRPEPETNEPSRNSPQNGPALQQSQRPRKRERLRAPQHSSNHVVLYRHLQSLCGSRGKASALLDCVKLALGGASSQKYFAEQVGRRHGVLNCQIDSHTADRRHGMRRVTNAQEPGPVPLQKPVDGNR